MLNQEQIDEGLSLVSGLNNTINNSEHKPPYQINIFDKHYKGIRETETSRFLKDILDYRENGEAVIVKSFIEKFLVPLGFDISLVKNPVIGRENENIDLLISEYGRYSIVIENKLKGADFQRNQLARYVELQRIKGYSDEQIFVVILPNSMSTYNAHLKPSTWRLPPDWRNIGKDVVCKYNEKECLCDNNKGPIDNCEQCKKDLKDKFESRTIVIVEEMANWLNKECLESIHGNQDLLKSAIIQFADYLNGIYKNRKSNELKMEIEKYLRSEILDKNENPVNNLNTTIQKLDELSELQKGIEDLRDKLAYEVIDKWSERLQEKWGDKIKKGDHNFKIYIKPELQCGCWINRENGTIGKIYWGFYNGSNIKIDKNIELKEIVDKIIKRAEDNGLVLGDYVPDWDENFFAWDYTVNGDEVCDAFYTAAKELDYINN